MEKQHRAIFIIFSMWVLLMGLTTGLLLIERYFDVRQEQGVVNNEVSEWKTFSYYKYEFQYPSTWDTWMTFQSEVPQGCFAQGDSVCAHLNGIAFSANILEQDQKTCQEYWNGVGGPKAILQEIRTVNGEEFYYGKFTDDNLEVYHKFLNGSCFELTTTISDNAELSKILSTFKFINIDTVKILNAVEACGAITKGTEDEWQGYEPGPINIPLSCEVSIGPSFDNWKFEIKNKGEFKNSLNIYNKEGRFIQTLEFENFLKSSSSDINIGDDVNFDGYKDVRILKTRGASNSLYDYWIFAPTLNQFQKDVVLTSISNPTFDPINRRISAVVFMGVDSSYETNYQFKNGVWSVQ